MKDNSRRNNQHGRKKKTSRQRSMFKKKPSCPLLSEGIKEVDYKDLNLLKPYTDDNMKILPALDNHVSARMQRKICKAIKQARYLSLLPYTRRHSLSSKER